MERRDVFIRLSEWQDTVAASNTAAEAVPSPQRVESCRILPVHKFGVNTVSVAYSNAIFEGIQEVVRNGISDSVYKPLTTDPNDENEPSEGYRSHLITKISSAIIARLQDGSKRFKKTILSKIQRETGLMKTFPEDLSRMLFNEAVDSLVYHHQILRENRKIYLRPADMPKQIHTLNLKLKCTASCCYGQPGVTK